MVHHEFLSKPDLLLASTALQFSCSDVQPVRFRVLADGSPALKLTGIRHSGNMKLRQSRERNRDSFEPYHEPWILSSRYPTRTCLP